MKQRRVLLALGVVIALSGTLAAQNKDDKKKSEMERREVLASDKLVEDAAAGRGAMNDGSIAWLRDDVLKATDKKQFVPFTVTIDPSKLSGGTIAFYYRLVRKDAAPPPAAAPAPAKKDDKKDEKQDTKKRPDYPWEDVSLVQLSGNGPQRVSRSFAVGAGTYDVVIVAKDQTPEKPAKNAPPLKAEIATHTITVPDLWNDELNTSTVIMAERIEPLAAPLTPEQIKTRPYAAMGAMEIFPMFGELKYTKKSELSLLMLIYNAKPDQTGKPNLTVEFNFCQADPAPAADAKPAEPCKQGEKFFNRTAPENFNAQTLPAQWDAAAGHQIQAGQAVSLSTFPEGKYRLEIKVTDKLSNKTLTRDVNFTVSAS